jgi:glucose/arabinose dehydrogenase
MSATTRRRALTMIAVSLLPLILTADHAFALDPDNVVVTLQPLSSGLTGPVALAPAPDGSGRLFIVEQPGRVRVRISGSGLRSTPYLDIRSRVNDSGNEQGMLGIAFHPKYADNGYFFVSYTNSNGDLRVSRFRASPPSANTADPATERVMITIAHPDAYTNHNGGALAFYGGYLFISTGDGGGSGGPSGYAQNKDSLLGKILRIDIDHACGSARYCSPTTNPYYGSTPGRGEVWHWGLRNPWRFSFDKSTGYQWIADVGQYQREEINRIAKDSKGVNFGWDCYEGTLNTVSEFGGSYCSGRTFQRPIYNYSHSSGRCAIVGGYVYRGSAYSSVISGMYFYADYCTGEIWAINRRADGTWDTALVRNHDGHITSFGQSGGGELYVVDQEGRLYKITAKNK